MTYKRLLNNYTNKLHIIFVAILFSLNTFVNAQEVGPDTFVVVEPLPVSYSNDTIDFNSGVFGNIVVPFHGKVISKFGKRGSRMHTGTDVKLMKGDTLRAAFDGVVDMAMSYYGYGLLVTVKSAHNLSTYYAHLSKILVKKGQNIRAGDVVGLGGSTGRATTAHLHFEFRYMGKAIDPQKYFDFENQRFVTTLFIPQSLNSSTPSAKLASNSISKQTDTASDQSHSSNGSSSHVITKGDTLYAIARKYAISVAEICSLNGITTRTILKIGSVLKLQ